MLAAFVEKSMELAVTRTIRNPLHYHMFGGCQQRFIEEKCCLVNILSFRGNKSRNDKWPNIIMICILHFAIHSTGIHGRVMGCISAWICNTMEGAQITGKTLQACVTSNIWQGSSTIL